MFEERDAKRDAKRDASLTYGFPKYETYGLSSQLRRASFSIPMNISEGSCNRTEKDFKHYLRIALGSANEIETIFDLLIELEYNTEEQLKHLKINLYRIRKMLQAMLKRNNHA